MYFIYDEVVFTGIVCTKNAEAIRKMTRSYTTKRKAIAIPQKEILAEYGFTTEINETVVLEVVQVTGTSTFITLLGKDECYFAFRGDSLLDLCYCIRRRFNCLSSN